MPTVSGNNWKVLLVASLTAKPFVNHWMERLCVVGSSGAMLNGMACEMVKFVVDGGKVSIGWMAAQTATSIVCEHGR